MRKAFTLVELIVVITILAILGTIAFISLQSYSKGARDSKRIQDVRSLLTKLNVEQVKGTSYKDMIKDPDNHTVRINKTTGIKAYQGLLNFESLRENKNNFQDPYSGGDYDFATTNGVTEYNGENQMFNFIEGRYWSEKDNMQVIIGNYYKYDGSDSENLFDNTLINNEGQNGCEDGYKWSNSKKECIYFPTSIGECKEAGQVGEAISDKYSDSFGTCNENDIIFCTGLNSGYQISSCNVGTTIAGTGEQSFGNYFQWGANNAGYSIGDSTTKYGEWKTSITGTTSDTRNPCGAGYSLPDKEDWKNLFLAGNGKLWNYTYTEYISTGEVWTGGEDEHLKFTRILKAPLVGYIYLLDGEIITGNQTSFWTGVVHETNNKQAYRMVIKDIVDTIEPLNFQRRASGLSIRCFKD